LQCKILQEACLKTYVMLSTRCAD